MKNALILLALTASILAQATDFVRVTDFNKLETGDEVVITMTYTDTIFALNGDDAKNAVPKSDSIAKTADLAVSWSNPDEKYIFIVNKEEGGVSFTRKDGLMLYTSSSSKGVRVGTATNAKNAGWIWNVQYDYLYATANNYFIGVYHRDNNAENCKIFVNYPYSTGATSGWKKYINNETLAFYVNSPTGDPNKDKYPIAVSTVTGGNIAVSYPVAGAGTAIEVTLTEAIGYTYVEGSLKYTYYDGSQDVTMLIDDDNQFLMPNAAVTVSAEFEGRSPKETIDFTNTANLWQIPKAHTYTEGTYTYDGKGITIHPTGTKQTDGGYNWGNSSGGYLRLGQKNAYIQLPTFSFDVAKIIVNGKQHASEYTQMNIMVSDTAVSKNTTSSTDENIYLIHRNARVAGTQYNLTILNSYPAQFSTIDIYATVPNAPETPEVSIPEGLYKVPQNVKLSCYTEGATIYYTTNGTRPTEASTVYNNNTFYIDHQMTIRAIAVKNGVKSEIMNASYVIANVSNDGTLDHPYTVDDIQKLLNPGWRAWVHGYIINGFDPNIKDRHLTNECASALAIADSPTETDTTKMAFVELPQGKIRDSLNIVKHPEYVGKQVWLYGLLKKYGLQPGVTKTSKYYLDELPQVPTYFEQPIINEQDKAKKLLINGQLIIEYNGVWYTPTGARLEPR